MRKPESKFIDSIHVLLPEDLDREKMSNPFRRGTFDCWYSAARDLWIEYKFVTIPARDETEIKIDLSPMQQTWGERKHAQGRNVAVVVGCSDGGVIYRMPELRSTLRFMWDEFKTKVISREQVARWICDQAGVKFDPPSRSRSKKRLSRV